MRNPLLKLLKDSAKAVSGHGLGQIKPVRWLYDRLYQLFRPRWVWVQSHKMFLDPVDTLELATREIYEPLETTLLKDNLRSGQTFVDIGANIGYYTLLAARIVGPQGRVFAFEPDPDNFQLLKKNVETNGYSNVVLVPKAVSNHTGQTLLYLNPLNRGDHRLYDSSDGRRSISVELITLDDFFKVLEPTVHFIKMDIQGSEAAALTGMKKLLQLNSKIKLVSEFWPGGLKRSGIDPRVYADQLIGLGFQIQEINERDGKLLPVHLDELLNRFSPAEDGYTNFFCEKESHAHR